LRREIIPYNPKLTEKARQLRNHSTLSEVILWRELKGRQMKGYDFHRQKPLGEFIVDFFCNELMLAIEIDGESHYGNEERDLARQQKLEEWGITFLRFDDLEVKFQIDKVLKCIEEWIDNNARVQ
jgi:very-short-patch-repair endonuclease